MNDMNRNGSGGQKKKKNGKWAKKKTTKRVSDGRR